jgi:hypothetical protein
MKIKTVFFFLLFMAMLPACGPTIYYLGDKYDYSNNLQVFYDKEEIEGNYSVIGKMTIDKSRKYKPDAVKKKMVKKAQKYGAEAIIFKDFYVKRLEQERADCLVVNAELIKFHD